MARREKAGRLSAAFLSRERGGAVLRVRRDLAPGALAAGLDREDGWESRLDRPTAGRGPTGLLELAPGTIARLKRLRRGGLLAPLWRDRFPGSDRILANLEIPAEALRRGVPTPEPLALLAVPGPPGLWRGWLATAELPGAASLESRRGSAGEPAAVRAAMRVVRSMHDAGIEHRDLNVGNLVVRPGPDGDDVFILDLDGARLHDGPLDLPLRRRALRRLERSTVKTTGVGGFESWYLAYAAGDAALAARLASARWAVRMAIALHRLGWKDRR